MGDEEDLENEKVIKYDDVTYSNVSNVFRMFK